MSHAWPWITLALLGAYHGINPGMGWLFAVALGLQERSRKAVVRAFAPIAIGHFASIAAVVLAVIALQAVVPAGPMKYAGAATLIGYGLYKLLAPMSHPRWVGMRVSSRQLALWSFLMATAHGAGLMVVPVVLRLPAARADTAVRIEAASLKTPVASAKPVTESLPACHVQVAKLATGGRRGPAVLQGLAAVSLHTLAMFLVMAVVAVVVFEKVGLAILRTAWYNLDLVWAAALIGAGIVTVFV